VKKGEKCLSSICTESTTYVEWHCSSERVHWPGRLLFAPVRTAPRISR